MRYRCVSTCCLGVLFALLAQGQTIRDLHTELVKRLPSPSKRWALLVGIDQYKDPHIGKLRGAGNDARALAKALATNAGFPEDQIIVLATGEPSEREPTRINILHRLSNLRGIVPHDGLFLFSFSGHGIERAGKGFLIPSDAQLSDDLDFLQETALNLETIKTQVRSMLTTQAVMLIDACRNNPGGRSDADNPLTQKFVDSLKLEVGNHGIEAFAVIYAASVGQRAYEYAEKSQGYFTWALVEGLRGAAANSIGNITLAGLVEYVQRTVPKRVAIDLGVAAQQRPYAVIEGYRADELMLATTKATSSLSPRTNNDAPATELPMVAEFLATPQTVASGEMATIKWAVDHAHEISISGIGSNLSAGAADKCVQRRRQPIHSRRRELRAASAVRLQCK
jgi:Caspase domain